MSSWLVWAVGWVNYTHRKQLLSSLFKSVMSSLLVVLLEGWGGLVESTLGSMSRYSYSSQICLGICTRSIQYSNPLGSFLYVLFLLPMCKPCHCYFSMWLWPSKPSVLWWCASGQLYKAAIPGSLPAETWERKLCKLLHDIASAIEYNCSRMCTAGTASCRWALI